MAAVALSPTSGRIDSVVNETQEEVVDEWRVNPVIPNWLDTIISPTQIVARFDPEFLSAIKDLYILVANYGWSMIGDCEWYSTKTGEMLRGENLDYPHEIVEYARNNLCPFWEKASAHKTHIPILFGRGSSLRWISKEIANKLPKNENSPDEVPEDILNDSGNETIPASYFALVTVDTIPNSHKTQKELELPSDSDYDEESCNAVYERQKIEDALAEQRPMNSVKNANAKTPSPLYYDMGTTAEVSHIVGMVRLATGKPIYPLGSYVKDNDEVSISANLFGCIDARKVGFGTAAILKVKK